MWKELYICIDKKRKHEATILKRALERFGRGQISSSLRFWTRSANGVIGGMTSVHDATDLLVGQPRGEPLLVAVGRRNDDVVRRLGQSSLL